MVWKDEVWDDFFYIEKIFPPQLGPNDFFVLFRIHHLTMEI